MKLLANIISIIFQPLLMPSFIFLGLLLFMPLSLNLPDSLAWKFMSMILMTTFFIPLLGVLLLKFTKNISNLNMEDRKERLFPFLFNAVFYVATTYLFYDKFRFPNLVTYILIGITISIIVLTIVTLWWKISAHALASSGAAGIYFALLIQGGESAIYIGLSLSFLICGIVGWSRLRLNAHDSEQVWGGFLLGFILNFVTILLLN